MHHHQDLRIWSSENPVREELGQWIGRTTKSHFLVKKIVFILCWKTDTWQRCLDSQGSQVSSTTLLPGHWRVLGHALYESLRRRIKWSRAIRLEGNVVTSVFIAKYQCFIQDVSSYLETSGWNAAMTSHAAGFWISCTGQTALGEKLDRIKI